MRGGSKREALAALTNPSHGRRGNNTMKEASACREVSQLSAGPSAQSMSHGPRCEKLQVPHPASSLTFWGDCDQMALLRLRDWLVGEKMA